MAARPTVLAVVADLHVNSTIGLCPPTVERDVGTYEASRAQRWLWDNWLRFWRDVRKLARKHRARRVLAVVNGDLVDDNRHSKAQLIAVNKSVIVRTAVETLRPMLDVADKWWCVRGTEAHAGGAGELEELAAVAAGAEADSEAGLCSSWWLPLDVDGVVFDIAHHPSTAGYKPHTRAPAAARLSFEIRQPYLEAGDPLPDVALRAHVHYWQPGPPWPLPQAFYLPPWQLATAYAHRRGAGGRIEPPGGVAFVCQNGEHTWRALRYPPERRGPWRP